MTNQNSSSNKRVNFDEFLSLLGEYGRYQKLSTFLTTIFIIPNAIQFYITYFIAADSNWQCASNSSICNFNGTFSKIDKSRCSMPRSAWTYTKAKTHSIVTTYDIYCDNEWMIHLCTSLFFVGLIFGGLAIGWLSDKYGRKRVVGPPFVIMIVVGSISSFLPKLEYFLVCRFIIGFMAAGHVQMFILLTEVIGNSKRALGSALIWQGFPLGAIVLAIKAYFITDWRYLSLACSAPYIVLIGLYPITPESVRWLCLHNKTERMKKILTKIAKWNKMKIPDNVQIYYSNTVDGKMSTLKHLFQECRYINITIILGYLWFISTICFFGVTLAANDFGGSMYLNFVLIATMEVPALPFVIYSSNRFGRKITAFYSLLIGSLLCISVALIPKDKHLAKVTVGILGKFFVAICYDTLWTWSAELYPTSIRASGIGTLNLCGKFGGVMIPWVAKYLLELNPMLPFLVMGGFSFLGAFMVLWIPETKDKNLKE